jgi:hypothetical protein
MEIRDLCRRRHLRWLTTIAAIGGSSMVAAITPAFAASVPPAPDVLVAPATPSGPSAHVLYSEGFSGTNTEPGHWLAGGNACLTAGAGSDPSGVSGCTSKTPDKAGSGALRLTGNSNNETGFVLYQSPLDTGQGADIRFDMYQYHSLKAVGADGISFFLVDGTATPTVPGQYGGNLGYAADGAKPGLQGAIVGIGFDEYGNYSMAGAGHVGGFKDRQPDNIVARGATASNYAYIAGKKSPVDFYFDKVTDRAKAKVPVEIEISTANAMNVYVGSKLVLGPLDLSKVKGQPALPPTIKFGFAASTGAAAAMHEITGLTITTLRPDLVTTVSDSGNFTQGGTGTISVDVANGATAGPTDQPVTVTIPVPNGLTATAAAGPGWGCVLGTGTVTCTRSDQLMPGKGYPTVTVTTSVAPNASSSIPVTVSADTQDQQSSSFGTHTITVGVTPVPAPQLTTTITPVGTFTSPGTGTYQANVTDSPNAGPVTGTTTETFTVPAGQTVTSATGNGWTCNTSGQQVTCTTQATANPGDSLPPVTITTNIPGGAPASVSPTATVTTAGQSAPSTSPPVTIPITPGKTPIVTPPHVTTTITPVGTFTSPGTGTYQANVSDDPSAGPTTGPTTETFTVPAGQTVTSAAGDGWQCSTAGQQVTCTTNATVQPGGSFPPVTIAVNIPGGAPASVSPTASATTPGQSGPSTAPPVSIPVKPGILPPHVTTTITPVGTFTSPGTGTYQANVSDDPAAGPTTGPTTETFTVPDGQTVTSATGDGWTCNTAGQRVTCTTNATVQPGGSFPPVTIAVNVPSGSPASVSPAASATTQGQSGPSTSPPVSIPVTPGGTVTPPASPPHVTTTITPVGTFTSPGTGTYQANVSDDPAAGPTTGPTTETFTVPAGQTVTSATGDGWTCTSGQQVTCTTNATVQPGGSFPPVSIAVNIPAGAPASVSPTATADTQGQSGPSTAPPVSIPVKPGIVPPHVTTTITPVGTFTSPGTGTYQANVSDDPAAGPTTGPTTETFTVPAGQTVTSATGDGWTCSTAGQQVTCTTKATVQPGGSFPPVAIAVNVPGGSPASVSPTASADTQGQSGPSTSPPVSIPVKPGAAPAHVSTTITPIGTFTSPGTGTYQANVSDDANAGPTTGPTTETFTVPAGQTVTSAAGDGWQCSVNGQQVTCTTNATVQPGASFPPVTIQVGIAGGSPATVSPTATATTQGQSSPSTSPPVSVPVTKAVPPPSLTTTISPVGTFTSPGTGTYQASVTDDPAAGPTTGTTTETFNVPTGQTVKSATGDGWQCSTSGQQVTCTTTATVQPGGSLPPVQIGVSIPAGAPASVSPTATVTTTGQSSPSDSDPVTIPVTTVTVAPPRGPDLGVSLTPQGALVSGDNGTLQIGVSNAAAAGPTTGPVTVTYTVPNGSEVTKASGSGWTCTVARWLVTCTRPGTGSDALAGGASYPPVTLVSTLCHKAVCTLAGVKVNVNTAGDANPAGSTLTEDLAIQRQSSVQVTMAGTPSPYQPGKPVTYTVTVTNAGPTDSAGTTVALTVPKGFTGAWTCTASFGSGCSEPIGTGNVTVPVYVAAGGTVTLTATGPAPAQAGGAASASVSLNPGYTDTQCGLSCTAAAMTGVPVAVPPATSSSSSSRSSSSSSSSSSSNVSVNVSVGGRRS